jgi:outer membrane protein OmpA-like peptidoglycan-associated protein
MRYSLLASALSMVLGGAALAGQPNQQEPKTPAAPESQTSTAPSGESAAQAQNAAPVEVFFDTDSAAVSSSADAQLQQLANWARCNPGAAILLNGHADARGTQAYNLKLSGERAAAVRQKLIGMGVPSDHIVVVVYGENGTKRATLDEDRRVTARPVEHPIAARDLTEKQAKPGPG